MGVHVASGVLGNCVSDLSKIKDLYILIGIPCSWETVSGAFVQSLIDLRKPFDHEIKLVARGLIDEMRNELVKYALSKPFTHLFMLDADMVYPEDALVKLVECDVDIVAGLSPRRVYPYKALYLQEPSHPVSSPYECVLDTLSGEPGLREVKCVGAAGMLIKRSVLQSMKYPWFLFSGHTESGNRIGEDIYFCVNARKDGYKVYCLTSLPYGHIINEVVWWGSVPKDSDWEWKVQISPLVVEDIEYGHNSVRA